MSSRRICLAGLPATILAALLVTAACGSAASPTPAPTAAPTPTVAPTPAPTAAPASASAAPSATAAVDPAEGLTIGAPYTLVPLDDVSAAAFSAGLEQGMGSMAGLVQIGIRQVETAGAPAGLLMVLNFPGLPFASQTGFLDSIAGGMAGSAGGTTSKATIAGQPVVVVTSKTATWVVYQHDSGAYAIYAPTAADATAIATAVIKANG